MAALVEEHDRRDVPERLMATRIMSLLGASMMGFMERMLKRKLGLLNLAEELGNVPKAFQVMGLSRDTFYRYKSAVEDGGVEALLETVNQRTDIGQGPS